jgi:hypothetical protein
MIPQDIALASEGRGFFFGYPPAVTADPIVPMVGIVTACCEKD